MGAASTVELGDIAEFINGGAWNQSAYAERGAPVVRVSDIHNYTVDLSNCKYLSESALEKYSKNILKEGDLVICTVGSHPTQPNSVVGRPGIMPKSCDGALLNQNAVCIRPISEKLDRSWLGYLAKSQTMKDHIIAHARGSASQVRVAIGALKSFKFELPSIETQTRVASMLEAYDNLIENNNRRIAILEDMAQSLYREWFVKFRFPGYQDCEFQESELGLIPEGWEVRRFGELVHFLRESQKKGAVSENTPYMGLEHFPRKSLSLSQWDLVNKIGSSKLKFQKGDILFGKIRPYFHKVGVAQTDGLCSSDTFVWRTIEKEHFGLATGVVFSDNFVAHSVKTSQGTKMPRANWDVLKEYSVAVPSQELLEPFNEFTTCVISEIAILSKKNRNLKKQRDILLPKLISGEIASYPYDVTSSGAIEK